MLGVMCLLLIARRCSLMSGLSTRISIDSRTRSRSDIGPPAARLTALHAVFYNDKIFIHMSGCAQEALAASKSAAHDRAAADEALRGAMTGGG